MTTAGVSCIYSLVSLGDEFSFSKKIFSDFSQLVAFVQLELGVYNRNCILLMFDEMLPKELGVVLSCMPSVLPPGDEFNCFVEFKKLFFSDFNQLVARTGFMCAYGVVCVQLFDDMLPKQVISAKRRGSRPFRDRVHNRFFSYFPLFDL